MTFGQRARAGDIDRPSGGVIGMLVRSASFGRREKPSRRPDPPTETEESSHSPTDSRSGTPEADRIVKSNFVEKTEPKPIMTDRQFGWLQKKHHRSGGWAKRYFYVDETRGTLSYAKSVMSVTKKALDDDPCTFVIKCPPIHLTVAAVSPKEAKVWMTQLELRAQVWREKQNAKQPVATAEMLQAMLRRPASGAGSSVRSEADGDSSTTPSLLSSRDVSHEPSRAASPEGDAGHSVGADPLQPRPARATLEWDSGDEDVEPDRVNSANRADGPRASPPMRSAAPVPLSQIIANDDDDDDEAQEVDIVREAEEARERVRQQSARQRAERAPPTLAVEDESAEAQGAAPDEVAGRLPSPGVDRWDDGDDDWGDEEEDPRTAPAAPVSPRVVSGVLSAPGIVADENFAEDNWDNDEE
ncbi:hypothetical protein Ctob_010995 [Chrysochromulina tobinii]|uniref:PH domain-containing protein n=1 Tax=Chrysochromulina tobinii TaxID=1460289 RepID=A0A0M0JFS7_9EUKA|nr:hypothetical protein Ctob_010995 [Chrysochromulina tobinii]|eukprot:KOO25222.1 hypothetical protein Ctob_010995 [Chrysochromulina sp. CCMP291]